MCMNKKLCTSCDTTKNVSEFRKNKAKKDGLQPKCIKCDKTYAKEYYQKNKKHCVSRSLKNTKIAVNEYREWRKTLVCYLCPENDGVCIDHHHINPTDKKVNISKIGGTVGMTRQFREEIKKCIAVCTNCHRKIHKYGLDEYKQMIN